MKIDGKVAVVAGGGDTKYEVVTEAIIAYLQVPPPNVLLIGRMVSSEGIEPESLGYDTPH